MSSSSSSNYHLPAIAAMAGIALAASGYVISSSNSESKKRRRRIKSKISKERDDKYVLGLVNTGNSCFANSILQALATLSCLRSYLAERVDEQGDEAGAQVPPNEFILQSVAFALYSTIEMLNRPLSRPRSIAPTDIIQALERQTRGTISREQQDAHELFQIISSSLTSEEEIQYKQQIPSLLDVGAIRHLAAETEPLSASSLDAFESSSFSSMGTFGSMWSSFSVSTTGGNLHHRPRRPRNPFTGLAASKISCLKCGYTAPIRHHTFDNISLPVPQMANCTLESCLGTYTKMDILNDYQCRKCTLLATLERLKEEWKNSTSDGKTKHSEILKSQIDQLEQALQTDVENDLPGITLIPPETASCTSKQTMFANPPKSLCLHLSRSMYHPSGYVQKNHCNVQFPEYLDLAPYTTNGYLNTQDPTASLSPSSSSSNKSKSAPGTPPQIRTSRTSLVYLRNMAGKQFVHGQQDGLNVILPGQQDINNDDNKNNGMDNRSEPSLLPSLTLPAIRPIQYRLNAVIVHYGGGHESGHFITYRRKKLPTGQDARPPHMMMMGTSSGYYGGHNGIFQSHHPQRHQTSLSPSKFWRCNDESIEEVDLDTVLASAPYLLFYERE
ncbi:uncharacterized protein BX664DRAFT_98101 [Halteromyces radiatus]|uniref:uncharacterized protein n=1 Tax=Halteromyces radiatus TaxID=101107 RepID=UPI00221EDDED|nr:uncharacterized protein BX664DRAFT_98101 [Halteromyces radiatus]KAI8092970.1 hypothetical protein BX664DRAFT_98101 [Halteromyces radiatus]